MRVILPLAVSLSCLSSAAFADEAGPKIDLSTQSDNYIVEEEYQSIRPGAMDEKFQRDTNTGGTTFNLSYEEEEPETDEYGVIREIDGPATTDYSKPPALDTNE